MNSYSVKLFSRCLRTCCCHICTFLFVRVSISVSLWVILKVTLTVGDPCVIFIVLLTTGRCSLCIFPCTRVPLPCSTQSKNVCLWSSYFDLKDTRQQACGLLISQQQAYVQSLFSASDSCTHAVGVSQWMMLSKCVEGGLCISYYKWMTTQLLSHFPTRNRR